MPLVTTVLTDIRDDLTMDNHWYGECAVRLLKSIPVLTLISDSDPDALASERVVIFRVGNCAHFLKLTFTCTSATDLNWKFYTVGLSITGSELTYYYSGDDASNRFDSSYSVFYGPNVFCDQRRANRVVWFKATDGNWYMYGFNGTGSSTFYLWRNDSDNSLPFNIPTPSHFYGDAEGTNYLLYPAIIADGFKTIGLAKNLYGRQSSSGPWLIQSTVKDINGISYILTANGTIMSDGS